MQARIGGPRLHLIINNLTIHCLDMIFRMQADADTQAIYLDILHDRVFSVPAYCVRLSTKEKSYSRTVDVFCAVLM